MWILCSKNDGKIVLNNNNMTFLKKWLKKSPRRGDKVTFTQQNINIKIQQNHMLYYEFWEKEIKKIKKFYKVMFKP